MPSIMLASMASLLFSGCCLPTLKHFAHLRDLATASAQIVLVLRMISLVSDISRCWQFGLFLLAAPLRAQFVYVDECK